MLEVALWQRTLLYSPKIFAFILRWVFYRQSYQHIDISAINFVPHEQFLAYLAKGEVSFYHELATFLVHPLAFHIYIFLETIEQIWNNVARYVHWLVQICVFDADLKLNMTTGIHNVFSLGNHQTNLIVTL